MNKQTATVVDIGIQQDDRAEIARGVSRVLADSYTLYLKTHNYHWNVTGPMFATLHQMFEAQYTELAAAVDEIAERIRALGLRAPGSYREFGELSAVKEEAGDPDALAMVAQLAEDHATVARTARDVFKTAAAANDEVTTDLLVQRMQVHEKTAWMLRSLLDT